MSALGTEPTPGVAAAGGALTVTVVICAFTERRWDALGDAVGSVLRQSRPAEQVVVVVDHNDALLERARAARWPGVEVLAGTDRPGLAGARNTGVAHASGDVVAFLDDDACAEPDWLARLAAAYADEHVAGVGGHVEPAWSAPPPAWLPREFHWTVGCSYTGLPAGREPVRNPIGANMSFRRESLQRAGTFRTGMGRTGVVPLGCEETELAIRVSAADPAAVILYDPAARVRHTVWPERATWRYFRARCWAEGLSKAAVAAAAGAPRALASERRYATRTLPAGLLRALAEAVRGDAAALARAGAIAAGLAITSAGYLRGRLSRAGG